jgi:hypothetical protein
MKGVGRGEREGWDKEEEEKGKGRGRRRIPGFLQHSLFNSSRNKPGLRTIYQVQKSYLFGCEILCSVPWT